MTRLMVVRGLAGVCASLLSFAVVGFAARPGKAQSDGATSPKVTPQANQVVEFMLERKRAYEQNNSSAWGKHVAEQCLFIQAGGRILSKAQSIAEMAPFVGYTFTAVVSDVRATEFGDTIILAYRENEIRDYGVQRTENKYLDAETYTRLNGEFQLVSWMENSVPDDPPIVKLDPKIYDEYVGTYEVNPKATFPVTREGNKLMGQYAGEEKFELLPASRSSFFGRGDSAMYAFVRDKSGRVVGHIYRAEGVETKY